MSEIVQYTVNKLRAAFTDEAIDAEEFLDDLLSFIEHELEAEMQPIPAKISARGRRVMMKVWGDFLSTVAPPGQKAAILMLLDHLETWINEENRGDYFLTPKELSSVMVDYLSNDNPKSIYDPYAGSGGLLAAGAQIGSIDRIRGMTQMAVFEKLMRLRLLLSDKTIKAEVGHHPVSTTIEKIDTFDIILANPPYGGRLQHSVKLDISKEWLAVVEKLNRKDAAYLGHIFTHMAPAGRAAVLLPTFFLSGPRVKELLNLILNKNFLNGVVLLPQGIFENSPIAPALFLFDKGRVNEDRLFLIDASKESYKRGRQMQLKTENLDKWIKKIRERDYKPEENFLVVTLAEVKKKGISGLRPIDPPTISSASLQKPF